MSDCILTCEWRHFVSLLFLSVAWDYRKGHWLSNRTLLGVLHLILPVFFNGDSSCTPLSRTVLLCHCLQAQGTVTAVQLQTEAPVATATGQQVQTLQVVVWTRTPSSAFFLHALSAYVLWASPACLSILSCHYPRPALPPTPMRTCSDMPSRVPWELDAMWLPFTKKKRLQMIWNHHFCQQPLRIV